MADLISGSFDELEAQHKLDVWRRQELYLGLTIALADAALTGQPNPLTDEQLALLGRAIYRDKEAFETPFRMDDRQLGAETVNLGEVINRPLIIRYMFATNDPRLDRKVDDPARQYEPDNWEIPLVDNWDSIEEDALFNAALILMAGKAGVVRSASLGALKVASRVSGKLPSALGFTLRNNSARVVAGNTARSLEYARTAVPSSMTVGSAARAAWRFARWPVYAAGLLAGMQGVSILDNMFNYEENQEAIAALDVEVASEPMPQDQAAVAQMEYEGAIGEGIVAAPAGMAFTPPPPLEGEPRVAVSGDERLSSAQLYERGTPLPSPAAQQLDRRDDPWVGGFPVDWEQQFQGQGSYESAMWGESTGGLGPFTGSRLPSQAVGDPGQARGAVRYAMSDFDRIITSMTENDIINFQHLAQQAMMLNLGSSEYGQAALPGYMDMATRNAMQTVMTEANANGTDWRTALSSMVQAAHRWQLEAEKNDKTPVTPGYTKPAYREPDWEELVNDARIAVESRLGRPANQWELNLLAEEMKGYKEEWYEAEAAAHRAAWEAEGRAADTGEDQITGTFQEVNPDARFDEFFREKFATEISRKDRVEDVARKTSSLMRGFDNAASIVGGRG